MKKAGLFVILLAASVCGGNLNFESGAIKAHTEVFGDSSIDPVANRATSRLSMETTPSTLKGTIEVFMSDLISDNKKRDVHMHESLESTSFPKALFEVKEVVAKGGDHYTLKGMMNLHGVVKPMSFDGSVTEEGGKIRIKVASTLKMSDFGIKPIKMMFLTVRDQVDLNVDVVLKR